MPALAADGAPPPPHPPLPPALVVELPRLPRPLAGVAADELTPALVAATAAQTGDRVAIAGGASNKTPPGN